MKILDIVGCVVGIFGGIVGILTGLLTFVEKCKPYITQRKGKTEKDPSASFHASDGSDEDCISNPYSI